ncbi:MAG: Aconitate isomerase [Burkholderiaceae bacterium]|nr:Aconitate isomerase [Burkholderiaceae bacterium]
MSQRITGISSMATRALLADLARECERRTGIALTIESVGGVDAARRVEAGEAFDVVFLASDAIDRLVASGHVLGPRSDLARSPVAVAVRAGAPRPDVSTPAALEAAVLGATRISYSTGPSGAHLRRLFDQWGIAAEIAPRLVQAPPGVPVGALVARGDVDLGFQQLSELMNLPGVDVIGALPGETQFITTFSAGLCAQSQRADLVRAVLAFMTSPTTAQCKRGHGMEPG